MKCPYCNEDMEKGYISQTDFRFPLEWYPAKGGTGFWANKKGNVKLTASLKGGSAIAFRCAQCKKIIIDECTLEV